jgi:hypothetical protein
MHKACTLLCDAGSRSCYCSCCCRNAWSKLLLPLLLTQHAAEVWVLAGAGQPRSQGWVGLARLSTQHRAEQRQRCAQHRHIS